MIFLFLIFCVAKFKLLLLCLSFLSLCVLSLLLRIEVMLPFFGFKIFLFLIRCVVKFKIFTTGYSFFVLN